MQRKYQILEQFMKAYTHTHTTYAAHKMIILYNLKYRDIFNIFLVCTLVLKGEKPCITILK